MCVCAWCALRALMIVCVCVFMCVYVCTCAIVCICVCVCMHVHACIFAMSCTWGDTTMPSTLCVLLLSCRIPFATALVLCKCRSTDGTS